jgi:uncharacterized membrane protein YebE (DUF533 family)
MDISRLLSSVLGTMQQPPAPPQGQPPAPQPPQGMPGLGGLAGMVPGLGQNLPGALGGLAQNIPGGLAGGAAAGGILALLLSSRSARHMLGNIATAGGVAAVGYLAWQAYNQWRAGQQGQAPGAALAPPPAGSAFALDGAQGADGADLRLAVLRAMIAAAKADGHLDAAENARIRAEIARQTLGAEEKAFLFDQLDRPADPAAIASLAASQEQAAELYLASCLAIDPDTREERQYLDRLGDGLRLPAELRATLEQHAAMARGGA